MGKGMIVENLLYGKYKITRTYSTDYVALIKGWGKKIETSDAKLAELKKSKDTLQDKIKALQYQLEVVSKAIPLDKSKVDKAKADVNKGLADLLAANASIASESLKRLGLDQQLLKVKASQIEAAKVKEVWCATYSNQFKIGDKVDTIEIDDQSSLTLIAPEGTALIPGQLKRTDMGLPCETFYNAAMLPGMQKWRPRYKFGKITAINKVLNTCSVALEETSIWVSNAMKGLTEEARKTTRISTLIDDKSAITTVMPIDKTMKEVPIDYLKCNVAVFNVGNEVVVEFTGRKTAAPRVIGFRSNPRPCLPLLSVLVHAAGYDDYVMIWDMVTNSYYNLAFSPPIVFPCKATEITGFLSSMTEIGKNLFTVEDAGFAIEDWEGKDYDCTIVTPSNSTCHKITQVAEPVPSFDGTSGNLMNRREVYRIGAYALNWYDELHYIYDVIPKARRRDLQPLQKDIRSVEPMNLAYITKLYNLYDVPFPTKKITALNQSGYVGSAGTSFSTGRMAGSPEEEEPYPWVFRYSDYYGYKRYMEWVTRQYYVLTPLGEMLSTYGGGGKGGSYAKKTITKGAENTLNIMVGAGGTSTAGVTQNGTASTVVQGTSPAITVLSAAGGAGAAEDSQAGATAIVGTNIGDLVYEGGRGADCAGMSSGGGGGAAGPSGVGKDAIGRTAGNHGGGKFLNDNDYCGDGGEGVAVRNFGNPGIQYGGGGSGGSTDQNVFEAGGMGKQGIVVITWTTNNGGVQSSVLTSSNPAWPWSTSGGVTTITIEAIGGSGSGAYCAGRSREQKSNWTQYAGGDKEYTIRSFEKAQGIVGGQFTESVFTQFYLMQYAERILEQKRGIAETATYPNRVVIVQAQTQLAAKGYEFGFKTSPYNTLGRNSQLETAIQGLVAAWYAGNGLSVTDLKNVSIDWKMIS
jgi:hypothetical protein